MARKLSSLLTVLTVTVGVAVAVPALAIAAPEVTINGARAAMGDPINGVSTNTVFKTSIGNFTCATVEFEGEITGNNGTTFEIEAVSLMKTATCFFKGTTPITVHDPTLLSLHSNVPGSGTIGFTFDMTFAKTTCHYSSTSIPFEYSATGDSLQIKGGLVASPSGCGSASIEGTYELIAPGGAVVLH